MGADVHNRTDSSGWIRDDRGSQGASACRTTIMLFTLAVLVAAGGALILYKAQVAGRFNPADLGWMSEQWLAEHRASHHS